MYKIISLLRAAELNGLLLAKTFLFFFLLDYAAGSLFVLGPRFLLSSIYFI